ncbi:hypothetical protein Goshw_018845, partial [Gossypium schwendimanii]|nr:hypothetical protein [Gossypium schwendimanii]
MGRILCHGHGLCTLSRDILLNNITFVMPKVGILQAHYFHIKEVFKTFPTDLRSYFTTPDTNLLIIESHPFHIYGFNFFVVGSGVGNFDPSKDLAKFNLVNPLERNTVGVPTKRWTTIRFRADNPEKTTSAQPYETFKQAWNKLKEEFQGKYVSFPMCKLQA